jgi:hypothetical protein
LPILVPISLAIGVPFRKSLPITLFSSVFNMFSIVVQSFRSYSKVFDTFRIDLWTGWEIGGLASVFYTCIATFPDTTCREAVFSPSCLQLFIKNQVAAAVCLFLGLLFHSIALHPVVIMAL